MQKTEIKKYDKTSKEISEKIQRMDSQKNITQSKEENTNGPSLSMNVAEHLHFLMREVTRNDVTPQTVNAACNCATQLINLMKLNMKLRDQ